MLTLNPFDREEPVFAEPWEAQAFSLAVTLSRQGHFTWKEWASELAATLKAAADRGEPDDGSRYYEHWLTTLERLVTAKGLLNREALGARKEEWADAYLNTPHGVPVQLRGSRATLDPRWILPAMASVAIGYWIVMRTFMNAHDGSAVPPVGVFASAGFGSLFGLRHALEPDHLAAISTLMTGERSSKKAAWLGACWGLGHTLTLLVAGATLVLFREDMPSIAADVFEWCVILLLIGFGVRAMYLGTRGALLPTHTHAKLQPVPAADKPWRIAGRPLLVGAVHGLAGSGAITALIVTSLPSNLTRITYLVLFGLGTTVGMALLSGLMGWPLARLGAHQSAARTLSLIVGSVSVAFGLFLAYRI